MKKLISILVIVGVLLSGTMPVLAAESEGLLPSGVSYADIEAVVDSYVREHESTTAAVSVAVFTGQDVLMQKAYGYSDIENALPNDQDTVFEWGSMTKLLVWVSVMQLVEAGDIDLDADIRTYLPQGFLKKVKYDTPITMLNLMNHNAGWQETSTNLFIKNESDVKGLGETLQLIEPEQVNKPGTVVAYSNWGSALAGYIVEQVSGQSFADYVHEHIFEPLGMKHTALDPFLSDNPWVAQKRAEQKHYTADNKPLGTNIYHISLYPSGMATGTLSDFIKFGQALLKDEKDFSPLFQNPQTLDEMLSPSLFFADGETPRNCHGFWTDQLGVPVLWHDGETRGSSSWFAFDPNSGIGLITLSNQVSEQVYNMGLLPLVFGKYKGKTEAMPEVIPAEDISGTYVSSRSIFKGFAKPYTLLSGMKVVSEGDGRYSVPGNNAALSSLSRESFLLDRGGLKQTVVFVSTNENGDTVLQYPGRDYIEVNPYTVTGQYLLLVLFALAGLLALLALIISLFKYLKHRETFSAAEKYPAAVNASVSIAAVLFAYVAMTLLSGSALIEDLFWSLVLIGVLALVPVVYVVILAGKWRSFRASAKEKRNLVLTGVIGLIMTINIIFWETYRFW